MGKTDSRLGSLSSREAAVELLSLVLALKDVSQLGQELLSRVCP